MFTGPVGPVEVFFYWPEAVFGNFYWPGAIGLPLASSPDIYMYICMYVCMMYVCMCVLRNPNLERFAHVGAQFTL